MILRRFGSIAVLIERFQVKPSIIKPDSYGIYDKQEERFILPYVIAGSEKEAYDLAWKLKDEQDQLHHERKCKELHL